MREASPRTPHFCTYSSKTLKNPQIVIYLCLRFTETRYSAHDPMAALILLQLYVVLPIDKALTRHEIYLLAGAAQKGLHNTSTREE